MVVLLSILLVGCDKNEAKPSSNESNDVTTVENEDIKIENADIYKDILNDYENALAEYDFEDLDSDAKIEKKYPLVNISLIEHIARYADNGVKLTHAFYDINKDGIDELIVGAENACGAIYSYNKESNEVVKIYFLDSFERANLEIYDNGVISMEGSGGATIHLYEYGKISEDSTSYEVLESVMTEYMEEIQTLVFTNYETDELLDYKSVEEIDEKYISGAKVVDIALQ